MFRFIVHSRWISCLFAIIMFIAHGLVPNGYMLDRSDETGQIIITICSGIDGEMRYLALDPLTGEYNPVDGPEGNTGEVDHDSEDQAGMFCTIAGQVFLSAASFISLDFLNNSYTLYKLPFSRVPPLKAIAFAPLSARSPPMFLS